MCCVQWSNGIDYIEGILESVSMSNVQLLSLRVCNVPSFDQTTDMNENNNVDSSSDIPSYLSISFVPRYWKLM